ncbi:putative membrane protein [Wickerhamomyces ciferrii]|uniref:Membrane protein n=1 Tax=Wickerhamomyces ciferrii (strain ATCC 14091 / BCRC 22168 / CBS 111 / JCM 3599 / NBRC 0793 / NRRL Y-1031 F-60-10) TaxID=1206466 RepID=K0KCQ0_WICCF|nr:uncharacterized protein BN7_205 [Wickerhamomyces ciferrii]CCH40671.1 putative membrane protein [Wickerhamomyces ciferrii]
MSLPSSRTRIIQVTCAIIWCLFAAGPIFGFAALKPILIDQGVYHEVCSTAASSSSTKACVEQDLKLNKMFTIGAVVTNATALIVGHILDNYGPRICGIIGSILIAIGALELSSFLKWIPLDPYLTGYVFLALGGPFVFISSFQLANSFPKYSGMILALLTGAFDTSSAVFLCYRLIYQKIEKIPLNIFFGIYLIIPVFIFLCQVFIMPNSSYKTIGTVQKLGIEGLDENGNLIEGDDGANFAVETDERTSLLSAPQGGEQGRPRGTSYTNDGTRRKSIYEEIIEDEITHKSGNIFGILDGESIANQLKSPFFILMCAFTTIQMIRINYFVATIRSQETWLIGEELGQKINEIFDIALPLGGIVAIPFIGIILDNNKTVNVLTILLITSIFIGICGVLQNFSINLIGIFLLVVYRPFYYTAVSDYSAKVFGFTTFGTVYGLMMCISGIFNYAQTILDFITQRYENSNPIPINLLLVSLTVVFGTSLIGYILSQQKNIHRKRLELEADSAPEQEIPN